MTALTLPTGGACRLCPLPGYGIAVLAAADPADATPDALTRRGHISVVVTHDAGMAWPGARGEALAAAMLAEGGTVALVFPDIADALAAKRRLEGGGA